MLFYQFSLDNFNILFYVELNVPTICCCGHDFFTIGRDYYGDMRLSTENVITNAEIGVKCRVGNLKTSFYLVM